MIESMREANLRRVSVSVTVSDEVIVVRVNTPRIHKYCVATLRRRKSQIRYGFSLGLFSGTVVVYREMVPDMSEYMRRKPGRVSACCDETMCVRE